MQTYDEAALAGFQMERVMLDQAIDTLRRKIHPETKIPKVETIKLAPQVFAELPKELWAKRQLSKKARAKMAAAAKARWAKRRAEGTASAVATGRRIEHAKHSRKRGR